MWCTLGYVVGAGPSAPALGQRRGPGGSQRTGAFGEPRHPTWGLRTVRLQGPWLLPPPPPGVFTTATAFSFQLASLPHRDRPATDVRADGLRLGSQARRMKRLTAAADGKLLLS